MNFSSDIEVKTVELPDALEFTVTREGGSYEYVVAPVIGLAMLWYFWKLGGLLIHVFVAVVLVATVLSYIANRLHGRESKLLVREDGIIARGNLGRIFSTRFQVTAVDITKIRFGTDGEAGNPGLYVWQGWASTCVLPGIGSKQADDIVEIIARRFPHLPTELSTSAGWRGERLIELGLSKLNREDSDKRF